MAMSLPGCAGPSATNVDPIVNELLEAPMAPPSLERGRAIYGAFCASCHGDEGRGDGPAAPFLDVRPRALINGSYAFRTTESGELATDDDLYRTVSKGLGGTPMPAFERALRPSERRAVVAYIKPLSILFLPEVDEDEENEDAAVVLDLEELQSTAPPSDAAAGQRIFQSAGCVECHGESGRGDGEKRDELRDDFGHIPVTLDLTRGFLKRGQTRDDVFTTLKTGLDGTPMPSFADTLTDDEIWLLADYVVSLSGSRSWWQRLLQPVDFDY